MGKRLASAAAAAFAAASPDVDPDPAPALLELQDWRSDNRGGPQEVPVLPSTARRCQSIARSAAMSDGASCEGVLPKRAVT